MAKAVYVAPGMTIAEIEAAVARSLDWDVTNATELAKIDEAVTACGIAASTWNGRPWWWLETSDTFPTVDGTASYVLRTVDSSAMANLLAVKRAYVNTKWELTPMQWEEYRRLSTLVTAPEGHPYKYVVYGSTPTMYLYPTPGSVLTITVDYTQRHSKITSAGSEEAALIVPGEYQWGIYVNGATWLIKHETLDPSALEQCPAFVSAMGRMGASDPYTYAPDNVADQFPGDTVEGYGRIDPSHYPHTHTIGTQSLT